MHGLHLANESSNVVLSNKIWRVKKKTKQFFSMFESRFCNVLSHQLVFDNTSLQTLFSLVKITLDCYCINHLGNETFKKRKFRFSEKMKLHLNEHFVETFKLSLFKSFISEVVYVYLAGKICRVTI